MFQLFLRRDRYLAEHGSHEPFGSASLSFLSLHNFNHSSFASCKMACGKWASIAP